MSEEPKQNYRVLRKFEDIAVLLATSEVLTIQSRYFTGSKTVQYAGTHKVTTFIQSYFTIVKVSSPYPRDQTGSPFITDFTHKGMAY